MDRTDYSDWVPAVTAFVARLDLTVEKIERPLIMSPSPNARKRNGYRAEDGVRVSWKLVTTDASEIITWILTDEIGEYLTRKAAVAGLEPAHERLRKELSSRDYYWQLLDDDDPLMRRVMAEQEARA